MMARMRMARSKADKGDCMERDVHTPDGRTLAVKDSGDPAGRPVLVHMGTPNSRHLYGPNVRDATERGLRLISYDRPGYGRSSAQPGRTVADCADDVRTICTELGIDQLATWGISGGGPHVLACAALLPDLVTAAASLASLAPYDAEGLDYFAGMGQENVDDTRLYFADEAAARAKTEKDREELLATLPGDAVKPFQSLLTPTDAAALNGELGQYRTAARRDGLNCVIRPWGFDLASITVPVLLLHGKQDMFVPFGHGEWLTAHIPGVETRLLDDDGHLTLLQNRVSEVHAWLSEHL
jgi:pimeloyl-ACP methyl ester carboxylesterase